MAILVDRSSRLLIQGITGKTGRAFAAKMSEHRSGLVGGVTPGKAGQIVAGVRVFDTVAHAREATAADCSLIVVPAEYVLEAAMEAVDAGLRLAVVYTEGVPVLDALRAITYAQTRGMILVGPNSAGVASPAQANLSDLNDANLAPGPIGIVSKSGTLTYEVILELRHRGLGTSTVVCLGGDPAVGLDYATVLAHFDRDPDTLAIVLIGEIGGLLELSAEETIAGMNSPVVVHVAGHGVPPRKRMGHAGAVISGREESATAKTERLAAAGALPADNLLAIAPLVLRALQT